MSTEPNDGAPDVPPRHNGRVDDEPPAPWDHQHTPLARAFARSLERFQAVAGTQADELATGDRQAKALMLSGLELDANELDLYVEALVAGYTQMALDGDDAHAVAVMRGLAVHMLVVGELHAAGRIGAERLAASIDRAAVEMRAAIAVEIYGLTLRELGDAISFAEQHGWEGPADAAS